MTETLFDLQQRYTSVNEAVLQKEEELRYIQQTVEELSKQVGGSQPQINPADDVLHELVVKLSTGDFTGAVSTHLNPHVTKTVEDAARNLLAKNIRDINLDQYHNKRRMVVISHVVKKGLTQEHSVLVTDELTLGQVFDLACCMWKIPPESKNHFSLLSQTGSTWPLSVNVALHVCDSYEKTVLFLERNVCLKTSGENSHLSVLVPKTPVFAPILGEHYRSEYSEDSKSGDKGKFKVNVRRCISSVLVDFIATLSLLIVVIVSYPNLFEVTSQELTYVQDPVIDLSFQFTQLNSDGKLILLDVGDITTVRQFVQLVSLQTAAYDKNQAGRLLLAMPVRIRTNRVSGFQFDNENCPSFYENAPLSPDLDACFPAFSDTVAATESFFQGTNPNTTVNSSAIQLPPSAWEYQENSWSLSDIVNYPDSADIMSFREYPSGGYIYDIPTTVFLHSGFNLDELMTGWFDNQTRFLAVQSVYLCASTSLWVSVMLYADVTRDGIATAGISVRSFPAFENSPIQTFQICLTWTFFALYTAAISYSQMSNFVALKKALVAKLNEHANKTVQELHPSALGAQLPAAKLRPRTLLWLFFRDKWVWVDIIVVLLLAASSVCQGIVYFSARYRMVGLQNERYVETQILGELIWWSRMLMAHVWFFVLIKCYKFLPTPYLSATVHILYHAANEVITLFCMFLYAIVCLILANRFMLNYGERFDPSVRFFNSLWAITAYDVVAAFASPTTTMRLLQGSVTAYLLQLLLVVFIMVFLFPLLVASIFAKACAFEHIEEGDSRMSMKSKGKLFHTFLERKFATSESLFSFS